MKAKALSRKSNKTGYKQLVSAISQINSHMVRRAVTVANQALLLRNWTIGAYIVEYEQEGSDRAKYGERLMERLAEDLAAKGLKGLDERSLRDCRTAYMTYPQIRGSLTPELTEHHALPQMSALMSVEVEVLPPSKNSSRTQKPIRGSVPPELPTPLPSEDVLSLSWTKIQELIRISDPWKRAFFENECLREDWSVRELQRQVESLLYERTGLSINKKVVIEKARKQARGSGPDSIAEIMRDPYILEFVGLAERSEYSEEELETELLNHLQRFLLELGKGFCFESRQFRMTSGRKHHRVDLVFYHRVLRCHVLLDLKTRAFKHEDAGQMNFYVNWFKANMMQKGDNPPVGILLCTDKDGTDVEFATAGMDQKLFVSRYLTALPSAAELEALIEADRTHFKPISKLKRS
jgi:predicted nuclease of restriction endonuclease-like (RecB) superfamily